MHTLVWQITLLKHSSWGCPVFKCLSRPYKPIKWNYVAHRVDLHVVKTCIKYWRIINWFHGIVLEETSYAWQSYLAYYSRLTDTWMMSAQQSVINFVKTFFFFNVELCKLTSINVIARSACGSYVSDFVMRGTFPNERE